MSSAYTHEFPQTTTRAEAGKRLQRRWKPGQNGIRIWVQLNWTRRAYGVLIVRAWPRALETARAMVTRAVKACMAGEGNDDDGVDVEEAWKKPARFTCDYLPDDGPNKWLTTCNHA